MLRNLGNFFNQWERHEQLLKHVNNTTGKLWNDNQIKKF